MSAISQLPKQTQIVILGVLGLALCGVFYVYFISPLRAEVSALETEIGTLKQEIALGNAIRFQLEKVKQAVQEQEARLAELKTTLPDRKETADVIRQVYDLAVDSKLKIKSFTPQQTINNIFYEDWPILIAMEGTYNALGSFFQEIGAFQRLINVEDIKIQAIGEEATRTLTLRATCTATTFVYLEQPEATGEGSE